MLNAIIETLLPVFGITKPALASLDQMYVIPVKEKGAPCKPLDNTKPGDSIIETETSVFGDTGKIRSGTFDFASDKKGKREGSVIYLTTYDEQELMLRNVYPKNVNLRKSIALQKKLWSNGETLEEMCLQTKYGESTVEKRNAAFSAALDRELAK